MPRLLLVDDNPSIHKIAETLLSSSSIELICVGSASEALMMLDSGERFDVALLDTAMPAMDGWELLARMRKHPDSAFIPIAMMAGVLDTVDPEKLKQAPIQGFIKKPIELRELAERVQQLLATPVTLSEHEGTDGDPTVLSPFATVPGTKIKSMPEFRGIVDGPSHETKPSDDSNGGEGQDDLLLLTPEDFWFEEAPQDPDSDDFQMAQATAQAMAEAQSQAPLSLTGPMDSTLDLEELDLDALKDLPNEEPVQESFRLPEAPGIPDVSTAQESAEPLVEDVSIPASTGEFELAADASIRADKLLNEPFEEETLAIPGLAIRAHALSTPEPYLTDMRVHEFLTEDIPAQALADLGEIPDFEDSSPEHSTPEIPAPESPAPPMFEEAASYVEPHDEPGFPSAAAYALPAAALVVPAVVAMASTAASGSESPTSPLSIAPPAVSVAPSMEPMKLVQPPYDATALVQVLLSDPVLMDVLTKAVVAKLGDQALREIAWELMPELAEKLPR